MAEYVQCIAVLRGGGHEDTVRAAARVSVLAYVASAEDPEWQNWFDGPWVKSVRRARAGEFERLTPSAAAATEVGSARALGWVPTPNDALPEGVHKLQVSGTDFERHGWPPANGEPYELLINDSLDMSTGKLSAQAAHGLFGLYLALSPTRRAAWLAADLPFSVRALPRPEFEAAAEKALVTIADAGRTEIEPGSRTVAARPAE